MAQQTIEQALALCGRGKMITSVFVRKLHYGGKQFRMKLLPF